MRSSYWFVLSVVFVLAFAGCAPAATATTVQSVPPTPSSSVNYSDKVRATVSIDYPDEIVSLNGFIWVKTDDGRVVQVDPASEKVVGETKVDTTTDASNYCQGFDTDGTNIWACSASGDAEHRTINVVRIDPQSRSVVATVPVGKIFDQFEMPFLAGRIWVLTGNANQLVGIDVKTNQAGAPIALGARCFQLAALDKTLLATCAQDNLVLQIDPEKGQVLARAFIQGPRYVSVAANSVWVATDSSVVRLDRATLKPVVEFSKLFGVGDVYAEDGAVWVRQQTGFVYRIDPTNNQLVEQIQKDKEISIGSLITTADSVWTTASDDNILIRLNR